VRWKQTQPPISTPTPAVEHKPKCSATRSPLLH
jgi:hypothetical protein